MTGHTIIEGSTVNKNILYLTYMYTDPGDLKKPLENFELKRKVDSKDEFEGSGESQFKGSHDNHVTGKQDTSELRVTSNDEEKEDDALSTVDNDNQRSLPIENIDESPHMEAGMTKCPVLIKQGVPISGVDLYYKACTESVLNTGVSSFQGVQIRGVYC